MSSGKCINPACDARKQCGNFKRLSSSPYSRIKEGISAKPPRNSEYTAIPCVVRFKSCSSILARHWLQGSGDHHDPSSRCRLRDDGLTKVSSRTLDPACLGYLAIHPPSIRMVSPVIRDAALEAQSSFPFLMGRAAPGAVFLDIRRLFAELEKLQEVTAATNSP